MIAYPVYALLNGEDLDVDVYYFTFIGIIGFISLIRTINFDVKNNKNNDD